MSTKAADLHYLELTELAEAQEAVVVRAGTAFQSISAWHRRHPEI